MVDPSGATERTAAARFETPVAAEVVIEVETVAAIDLAVGQGATRAAAA